MMETNVSKSIAMAVLSFMAATAPTQQYHGKATWRGLMPRNTLNDQACRSKYKPHQGASEIARRKRQIEKGMLKVG